MPQLIRKAIKKKQNPVNYFKEQNSLISLKLKKYREFNSFSLGF